MQRRCSSCRARQPEPRSLVVETRMGSLTIIEPPRRVGALLHESLLARTMPIDRILTCRCDTTLVDRGRSSDYLWTSQRPNNGATRVRFCAVIRPLGCQLRLMPGARRRHRFGARHRVACGGLAGGAELPAARAGGGGPGSLDAFAHPPRDRCGDAPGGVRGCGSPPGLRPRRSRTPRLCGRRRPPRPPAGMRASATTRGR